MKVTFSEKYNKLSDMKPGSVAVSKDRTKFFVCGYHHDTYNKCNVRVVLELNNLTDQYTDRIDRDQPIKILEQGDRFLCEK